jgi:hypothetical protein
MALTRNLFAGHHRLIWQQIHKAFRILAAARRRPVGRIGGRSD